MPRLLAVVPIDAWALLEEDDRVVVVHPPFLAADRRVVPRDLIADAVAHHGYRAVNGAVDESWALAIARIRREAHRDTPGSPGDTETFLKRALAVITPETIHWLLDRIETQTLGASVDDASRALRKLLSAPQVQANPVLVARIAALMERADTLRRSCEEQHRVATLAPRIVQARKDPAFQRRRVGFGHGRGDLVRAA